jgi:hypothetical protein
MDFRYSSEKNIKLELERGVGFEEIIDAIKTGNMLAREFHPNQSRYPNQQIMYVKLGLEVYAVPFVKEPNGAFFLKTIYANRKARKKFIEDKLSSNIPPSNQRTEHDQI